MIGDFNIKHPEYLSQAIYGNYVSSYDYKKYLSYPAANYTLDYVVIPKEFKFKSLKCLGKGLSDHMALLAEVKL